MTLYAEKCSGCGQGPLLWASTGQLICPRPACPGHSSTPNAVALLPGGASAAATATTPTSTEDQ